MCPWGGSSGEGDTVWEWVSVELGSCTWSREVEVSGTLASDRDRLGTLWRELMDWLLVPRKSRKQSQWGVSEQWEVEGGEKTCKLPWVWGE